MLDFFPYVLALACHQKQFKCQLRPQQTHSPSFLQVPFLSALRNYHKVGADDDSGHVETNHLPRTSEVLILF